jgi:epothilone polyketide synthase D
LWESAIDLNRLPWLNDHQVQGTVVVPGTAYLEMALAAGSCLFGDALLKLDDVEIVQGLAIAENAVVPIQLVGEIQGARFSIQIASRVSSDSWQVHARATVGRVERLTEDLPLNIARIREQADMSWRSETLYETLKDGGLTYGPAFRGVVELWRGDGEALGHIRLPVAAGTVALYRFHPALLDACFHVMTGLFSEGAERTPWVPVRIDRLELLRPPPTEIWCYVTTASREDGLQERRSVNLQIVDGDGVLVAQVLGLVVQKLSVETNRRKEDDWFLIQDWERTPVPEPNVTEGRFLLLGGGTDPTALALGAALISKGQRATHFPDVSLNADSLRAILGQAFNGEPPTVVVHLGSLESSATIDEDAVEAALVRGCDSVLVTVQTLATMGYRDLPRLSLVTRGAQMVQGGDVCAPQAPLLGLGRVIAMEYTDLRCVRFDLDLARRKNEIDELVAELLGNDAEDEVAWRGGERYVARLDRRLPDTGRRERLEPAGERAFRLESDKPGVLDQLTLRAVSRRTPRQGEVEIAVEAAGMNFADVLGAMGFGFNNGDGPFSFGVECAGQVSAIGEGVDGLCIGQKVLAFAPFSMGSHAITLATLVVPCPLGLSAEQSATLPIVFMTAWQGLFHLARLRAGERVLIHSATGGTGQAAMQVARHIGAEIFATAGTPEKRDWLRSQGVENVMDSRSLEFTEQVLRATNGTGVDVVFNSLSGAAIEASFATLAPEGRFIEIAKRDIHANRPLGLGYFKNAISYSHLDLSGMVMRRPQQVGDLLREVVDLFARGTFRPLPVELFPISHASEAFHKMAQARHQGKLALSLVESDVNIRVPLSSGSSIKPGGTVLITGGLGGLALTVAAWLADRGVGHLVLMGRSGVSTTAQRDAVDAISAKGIRVTIAQGDVSLRSDVERAVHAADVSGLPLRGVIHAAGLLEDGMLMNQSSASFRRVMAPKIFGAVHLHALTCDRDLDFFVMYSSSAGLLGAPGQGNYSAANTFLDALAHHRRAHGLPALSIDWTAFSDVGLAAASENRGGRLSSRGFRNLTPDEGITVLSRLLECDCTQTGVVPFEVRQWLDFFPAAASSRTLMRLISAERANGVIAQGDPELLSKLAVADKKGRIALIEQVVRKHVSQVLRIPESKVTSKAPLSGLGMDSLMGLELRNRIQASLGISVPATLVWTYPTTGAVSQHLASVTEGQSKTPTAELKPIVLDGVQKTENVSETDVAQLIDQEFEALQ